MTTTQLSKVNQIVAELIDEVPDGPISMTRSQRKRRAAKLDLKVCALDDLDESQLVSVAANCDNTAENLHPKLLNLRLRFAVARWLAGHALIRIKRKIPPKTFTSWFKKHEDDLGFKIRTAQNHMKLARAHPLAESLISTLKENEQAEGNSENEPKTNAGSSPGNKKQTLSERLLAEGSAFQKSLRQMADADAPLTQEDLQQLTAVKEAIDDHFSKLVP
jgi:hypothetical protein